MALKVILAPLVKLGLKAPKALLATVVIPASLDPRALMAMPAPKAQLVLRD